MLVRISLTLRLANGTEIWTTKLRGEQAADSEEVRGIIEALRDLIDRVVQEARPGLADAVRRQAS